MPALDLVGTARLTELRILARVCRRLWDALLGIGDPGGLVELLSGEEGGDEASFPPVSGQRGAVDALRHNLLERPGEPCHVPTAEGWVLSGLDIRTDRDGFLGFIFCWHSRESAPEQHQIEELLQTAVEETIAHALVRGDDLETHGPSIPGLVGQSSAMHAVYDLLHRIIPSQSTVLIQAESGTGKELVAKAIHGLGPRRGGAFVAANCSAFNDQLLESTLFGHLKGSFTGAFRDQRGLFESADAGTLFLDEIGDMSPALQVKLLRVLQEGTFQPVGAEGPRTCDVRIIAATHRDLRAMVARGDFREDLYYRINVLHVELPPLRQRREDIPMLAEHFLRKFAPRQGRAPRLAPETVENMQAYRWPGNVRELENEIERLVVLSAEADVILPEHLSQRIRRAASEHELLADALPANGGRTLRAALDAVEKEVILQELRRSGWNKSRVARRLGISRSNLLQKVDKYGLQRRESPKKSAR